MTAIPEAVRRQAMNPFTELPVPYGWRRVNNETFSLLLHPMSIPQIAVPTPDLGPDSVDSAIDAARDAVREHGSSMLIWMTHAEQSWLAQALRKRGLVNEDAPGFEAIENAMALLSAPRGSKSDHVEVRKVETYDDFVAGKHVEHLAFEIPDEMFAREAEEFPARWAEYERDDAYLRWNALIDTNVVASSAGVIGRAGVNLFGGAVLESARGKGAYRALVQARWEFALERGTPALTVQAGRMSKPILEQLGFEVVGTMPVFVDRL